MVVRVVLVGLGATWGLGFLGLGGEGFGLLFYTQGGVGCGLRVEATGFLFALDVQVVLFQFVSCQESWEHTEGSINFLTLLLKPDLEFVLFDHALVFVHPRIILDFL